MPVNHVTDPRTAANRAHEYTEYALMHPSQFSRSEQIALTIALENLRQVVDGARGCC